MRNIAIAGNVLLIYYDERDRVITRPRKVEQLIGRSDRSITMSKVRKKATITNSILQ